VPSHSVWSMREEVSFTFTNHYRSPWFSNILVKQCRQLAFSSRCHLLSRLQSDRSDSVVEPHTTLAHTPAHDNYSNCLDVDLLMQPDKDFTKEPYQRTLLREIARSFFLPSNLVKSK
jgi:hypothetical protein